MALTYLPAATANAGVEAKLPSTTITRVASAVSGSTLTVSSSDAAGIFSGMTVTGAGITGSATVTGVVVSTGVVTLSGTIGTLTTTAYVFTTPIYTSLHTTSPSNTGANEVSGGSYARIATTYGLPSSGVKSTTNAQSFTSMPSATVGYFGTFSALTSGTWYLGGALASSLTVPSGATVAAAIGALTLTDAG